MTKLSVRDADGLRQLIEIPDVRPVSSAAETALGHGVITTSNTANSLSALLAASNGTIKSIPSGTNVIYLQPRADGVRYAHGGVTPGSNTTDPGTDMFQGGQYPLRLADFSSVKFVSTSNVVVSVEFRGY